MDREGYQKYLESREIPSELISAHIKAVEEFEKYLYETGLDGWDEPPAEAELLEYSTLLIQNRANSYDTYLALIRYAYHIGNDEVYLAVLQLLDGTEAMDNMYQKLSAMDDEELQRKIFAGEEPPPLGTPSLQKSRIMRTVIDRLEQSASEEDCKKILGNSLRDLPDTWYQGVREKYLAASDLDEFLQRKGDDFIEELETLRDEDRLFFNQKINDEVIAYVESRTEIRQGDRVGNILYEAKIPYMTVEYLAETNPQKKRYYYCHCPWARESLSGEEIPVSAIFCNCSAGYHKKYWEMVFDRSLKAEVIESVLKGDQWCKFAIHLPEDVLPD